MKKEITWYANIDKEHLESIWYGGDIVKIETKTYTAYIKAIGDIRAYIKDEYYVDKCNGGCFREYLEENDIHNDKEFINACRKDKIEFENNNWFEIQIWSKKFEDWIDNGVDNILDDINPNDNFNWIDKMVKELEKDWED